MLTRDAIKELIPVIGQRLKFFNSFSQLSASTPHTSKSQEEDQGDQVRAESSKNYHSISKEITVEHSKIFGRGKDSSSLTDWQKAVNASAFEIASEDPGLLYERATLKLRAEDRARASYIFKKKAGSRSVFTTQNPKRPKLDATERAEKIASITTNIEEIKKHIITKQNVVSRANSAKDYLLSDKVQTEIRGPLKEKERLEKELKVYKKKEARSKCYQKSKKAKHPSQTTISKVPLPPKDVQSFDIRTLFARESTESPTTNMPNSSIGNGNIHSPIIVDGSVAEESHDVSDDKETDEVDITNTEIYADDNAKEETCEDITDNKETSGDENHSPETDTWEESGTNVAKDNENSLLADYVKDPFLFQEAPIHMETMGATRNPEI